jgi:hypothetical protein
VSDQNLILEHLRILLTTPPGALPGLPEYGFDLSRFVFREPEPALFEEIRSTVDAAVRRWEPLAELRAVNVSERADQPGVVTIEIDFLVRRTGSRANLIYPFALAAAYPSAPQE